MKIHQFRLKAAIDKYGQLGKDGKTIEEIKAALAADAERGYTAEEIEEIAPAILDPEQNPLMKDVAPGPTPPPATQAPPANNSPAADTQGPAIETPVLQDNYANGRAATDQNSSYEEWIVELKKDKIARAKALWKNENPGDPMPPLGDEYFDKSGSNPIKVTRITEERAELLNEQSENTLLRLYKVKTKA